jgi:16S rRNA processing protein RimM
MDVASSFMLGVLTRPHGYKGDLVLFVDADEPDRYGQLRVLFVETAAGLLPHFVRTQRPHGDRFVVHLEGIDDEAAALKLAGSKVWLPLEQLPPLGNDALYLHEAPGMEVWNLDRSVWFGRVKRVLEHGPYPLLECDREGSEVIVPLPAELRLHVDRKENLLCADLPEGLLDVYLDPPGTPDTA